MARNMETGGQRIFPTFQQIGDNLSNTGTSIVNSLPNKNELTKALRDPEFYSDVGSRAKNMFTSMHPMDQVALTTAPFPILGDVTGLAADARMFSQEPESRTPLNFGLSALGALPFIPAASSIKAFHGTPHKVDKFSMDKIGTGEGAQAYGHGLYFAESEDVAKQYADTFATQSRWHLDGKEIAPDISNLLDRTDGNLIKAKQLAADNLKSARARSAVDSTVNLDRQINDLTKINEIQGIPKKNSNLYNVNLDVNPEDLLDWDAPLSEQPKKVQDLAKYYNITTTPSGMREARGSDIYTIISQRMQKPPFDSATRNPGTVEGSSFLKEQGIPGLKYYDGMSRGAGEGTRNYVMFDDNLIDIVDPIDDIVNKHNAALDSVK
tara:strand:+ start:44 stop:1183 length:1140 start_codon:yes stop_codon:yes gene_type:complete